MKLIILLSLVLTLISCGGSVDNAEPPAVLVDFKESYKLKLLHEITYGGSLSQYIRIDPLELKKEIIFSDSKGQVTVFDKNNFTIRWQKKLNVNFTSAIGGNNNLYLIGTRSGEVIALNPVNGDIAWRVRVSSEVLTRPVMSNNTVIVKTVDGQLTALNAQTGKQKWIYQREVPALSVRGGGAPYILQDKLITGLDNGKIVVLNVETGILFWEKTITIPRGRSEVERLVDLDADLIVNDNVIYIAGFQGRIVALDLKSGGFLWAKKMSVTKNMTLENNRLYITDDNSHIWALDATTGATVWKQTDFSSRKLTSPVIMGDDILIADFQGYLHIIAKSDGHQLARAQIDKAGIDVNPIVIGDKIYLQSKRSMIHVVKLSSLVL